MVSICGFLIESFVNNKYIEMIEDEFVRYQFVIINYVDLVNIEEVRECVGEV